MQTILVAEVCKQSAMQALVVTQEMPLAQAVRQFATNHDLRGIFITDANGRLAGVVNKQDLLQWVSIQMDQPLSQRPFSLSQMRRLLGARQVIDLVTPGSETTAVRLDETLADALDKMTRHQLADIPVVDDAGHIVNDLRLSEVLAYILNGS